MQTLYTAAQFHAIDRRAIESGNRTGYKLMQQAAASATKLLRFRWPDARRITVLCGPGSNGGDGLVMARLLHQQGLSVVTMLVGKPEVLQGEAHCAYNDFVDSGCSLIQATEQSNISADVLVDALFGSGLSRDLSGTSAALVDTVNASRLPVLSVDVPSGVCSDTGAVLGCAIRSDATISFIALKQGMFTADGPDHCGALFLDTLDVPDDVYDSEPPSSHLHVEPAGLEKIRQRPQNYHKGDCGHVLVIGGNRGYAGAALLAGYASLRTGAGRVSVACHPECVTTMHTVPELMTVNLESTAAAKEHLSACDVVVIGPGLGQDDWARELLPLALKSEKPTVFDADALNLLSRMADTKLPTKAVLTPHPAEAARLLSCKVVDVQKDRFAAVNRLYQEFGVVSLLKGNGTLVCSKDGINVLGVGNPAMATAGMGDVLSGIIAGLLGQGFTSADAAISGGVLHAKAGAAAADSLGVGLTATDVIDGLGAILA